MLTNQDRKEEIFFETCNNMLGSIQTWDASLDLEALGLPAHDLANIGEIFQKGRCGKPANNCPRT
jgi:hypothetical protein